MTAARYRRLLWAYPGHYRRRHGDEIVTTMLDLAESGHGRPGLGQKVNLVVCGLRQRFRLPTGRPLAAITAVLAAVALGALGTAGGTWLGWQTAAAIPSDHELRTLTTEMSGIGPVGVALHPWKTEMQGPAVSTRATGDDVPYSAERVRTGLTSAGWRITTFTETAGTTAVSFTADPTTQIPERDIYFAATKGDLALVGNSSILVGGVEHGFDQDADLGMDVWVRETAGVRPLTIAGLVLGMLAGWLITAALAYRIGQSSQARRAGASALAAVAVVVAAVPAVNFYRGLYLVLSYDSHAPNPYYSLSPNAMLPTGLVLGCIGIGLLALATAFVVAAPGREKVPDPARGLAD
jgi:hypothetical protein